LLSTGLPIHFGRLRPGAKRPLFAVDDVEFSESCRPL